jgi:uncharacterized membrane protein
MAQSPCATDTDRSFNLYQASKPMNTVPSTLQILATVLAHTPVWVWGLLVILLALGVLYLRERRVSRLRLTLVPVGLAALSISGVVSAFGGLGALGWLLGVGLAFAINTQLPWTHGARREGAAFVLPGSAVPMALMLAIFALNYAMNVWRAMAAQGAPAPSTAMGLGASLLFGVLSGLLAARAWRVLRLAPAT